MADAPPLPALLMTVVAAALVDGHGQVLVQQRPSGTSLAGLWEFPGGKLEPGETPETALVRELHEELGIMVDEAACDPVSFVSAPAAPRHLLLLLYLVRRWSGTPRPIQATALRWLDPATIVTLPMPPADRPLAAVLHRALAG